MPFVTAEEFQADPRFSAFAGAALTDLVTAYLAEADFYVDTAWREELRVDAQSYFVAHALTRAGYGSANNLQASLAHIKGIQSFKIDDHSVTLSRDATKAAMDDDFQTTHYGQKFSELRRLAFPSTAFVT